MLIEGKLEVFRDDLTQTKITHYYELAKQREDV